MTNTMTKIDYSKYADVFAALKLLGAVTVRVHFDGSGDSGQVEEIAFFTTHTEPYDDEKQLSSTVTAGAMLPWPVQKSVFDIALQDWVVEETTEQLPLEKIIEQIAYDILEDVPADWVNNEGGWGYLFIYSDTDFNRFRVEMNVRETITHYSEHLF